MSVQSGDIIYFQFQAVEGDQTEIYQAIVGRVDDDSLYIGQLSHKKSSSVKKLVLGEELYAYYLIDNEIKHYFSTIVTGFDSTSSLSRIRKPHQEEISVVQRRQYLRVKAQIEVAIKKEDYRFVAITDNVSAGGLSFTTDVMNKIQKNDLLECWLLLHMKNGKIDHIPLTAKVMSVIDSTSLTPRYLAEYTVISEMDRQKMIRYCFERQFDFRVL